MHVPDQLGHAGKEAVKQKLFCCCVLINASYVTSACAESVRSYVGDSLR